MDTTTLKKIDKIRLKRAAQMAHLDYVKSARPADPSLQDWKNLPESLKLSNFHQVAYWERVLREHGLGVRKLVGATKRHRLNMAAVVGQKGIRKLAEIEHGRWNVERLSYGWRYAEEKDVLKKLSPYLVPWNEVPPSVQQYDIVAIRKLPTKLRQARLALYKLSRNKS